MTKQVLDVGNCSFDHAAIRRLIEDHFDAQVTQARGAQDALAELGARPYDLVLVNRRLNGDRSDGTDLVRTIKTDDDACSTPVMLITNFAEYQQAAEAAGAAPGFGKQDLGAADTLAKLGRFLGEDGGAASGNG
jgi:DNA-binding NtrC family response regulator